MIPIVFLTTQGALAYAYRHFPGGYQGGRGISVGNGYHSDRDFFAQHAGYGDDNQGYVEPQPYFPAEQAIDFDVIIARLFQRLISSKIASEAEATEAADFKEITVPEAALPTSEDPTAEESSETQNADPEDVPAVEEITNSEEANQENQTSGEGSETQTDEDLIAASTQEDPPALINPGDNDVPVTE